MINQNEIKENSEIDINKKHAQQPQLQQPQATLQQSRDTHKLQCLTC